MLIQAEESFLLLIDVQSKLISSIVNHAELVENCAWLIKAAQACQIPMVISEQYPQGLGATIPELATLLVNQDIQDKIH